MPKIYFEKHGSTGVEIFNYGTSLKLKENGYAFTNLGIKKGKMYWEVTIDKYDGSNTILVGICNENLKSNSITDKEKYAYYSNNGYKCNDSSSSYGESFDKNDVIGVLLDMDNKYVSFSKNGKMFSTAFSDLADDYFYPYIAHGSNSGSSQITVNFGTKPFKYAKDVNDMGFKNFTDGDIMIIEQDGKYYCIDDNYYDITDRKEEKDMTMGKLVGIFGGQPNNIFKEHETKSVILEKENDYLIARNIDFNEPKTFMDIVEDGDRQYIKYDCDKYKPIDEIKKKGDKFKLIKLNKIDIDK